MAAIVGAISEPGRFDRRAWNRICADQRRALCAYYRDLRRINPLLARAVWRAKREFDTCVAEMVLGDPNPLA